MRKAKRLMAAAVLVAAVLGSTGPVVVSQAGVSTSPGRQLARKAGTYQQEYHTPGARYLAIPGVRGTGGGTGRV